MKCVFVCVCACVSVCASMAMCVCVRAYMYHCAPVYCVRVCCVQCLLFTFSAVSPMMILPPLLLVFSTDSAVLSPCSCLPRPCPSRKPYFCIILWATVPLWGTAHTHTHTRTHARTHAHAPCTVTHD